MTIASALHRPVAENSAGSPPPPPVGLAAIDTVFGAWSAAWWPAVAEHLDARLAVKDLLSGRWLWADAGLVAGWGRRHEEVVGRTDAEVFDPATAAALRAADHTAGNQTGVLSSEHHFQAGDRVHDVQVLRLAGPAEAGGSRPLLMLWIDRAATLRQQARLKQALDQVELLQQQLQQVLQSSRPVGEATVMAAPRDPVSGLLMRDHFEDQFRREADLSSREHREFALVFVRIDAPADGSAPPGTEAAARVQESLGRLLRGNTRAMDAACRYDDQRFALLLSGVGLATAHSRMEGLRRQCATQIVVQGGREFGFTVAMGVASFPHTAQDRTELVVAAESALAEAMRRGGNHVALASIRFEGS